MKKVHWACFIVPAIVLSMIAATQTFTQSADPLVEGFKNPPDSARPRTWWHWTQGNVTKEGITKDLEWMRRFGIAGFHLADVASGSGEDVQP
jgi:hypothetical protein